LDSIIYGTDSNNYKKINASIHTFVDDAISRSKSEFKMQCYSDKMIKGFDLSEKALGKIRNENYIDFVGKISRPVNISAMKDAE
jgi:hypothetical protein